METVDIGRDKAVRDTEVSRTTLANGVGLGMSVMRELIGRELANNPNISIEDHLTMVIGTEINTMIRGTEHVA